MNRRTVSRGKSRRHGVSATGLVSMAAKPSVVVMNVSSGLAFVPLPLTPTYCATKSEIHSYTQSLRA